MIQGYNIGMKNRNDLGQLQQIDAKTAQNDDLSLLQSRFTSIEDWSEAVTSESIKSEQPTPVATPTKNEKDDKSALKKELIVGGTAAAVGGAAALLAAGAQAAGVSQAAGATTIGAQATSTAAGIGAQAAVVVGGSAAQAAALGPQPIAANAVQKNLIGNSLQSGAKDIKHGSDLAQEKMTISPDNLDKQEFAGLDSSADPVEVSSLVMRQMTDPKSVDATNSMSKSDVETIKNILDRTSQLSTASIEKRRLTKQSSVPSRVESLEDTISSLVLSRISQALSINSISTVAEIPAEASTSTLQSINTKARSSTKSGSSRLSRASSTSTAQSREVLAEASNITHQSDNSILSRDSNVTKASAVSSNTNADMQAQASKSTIRSIESKIASSINSVISGISKAFSSSTASNQEVQALASSSTVRSSASKKTKSLESVSKSSQNGSVFDIAVEKPSDATVVLSGADAESEKSGSLLSVTHSNLLNVSNQSIVNHSDVSLSIRDSKASLSNSPSAVSQPSNEFITAKNSVASSISTVNSIADANGKLSDISITDQSKKKNRCCIIQ